MTTMNKNSAQYKNNSFVSYWRERKDKDKKRVIEFIEAIFLDLTQESIEHYETVDEIIKAFRHGIEAEVESRIEAHKIEMIKDLGFQRQVRVRFEMHFYQLGQQLIDGQPVFLETPPLPPRIVEGVIVSSHRTWFFGIPMVIVNADGQLYEVEMIKCSIIE